MKVVIGQALLALLVAAAVFAGGLIVGRATAPPCCVYSKWLYDPDPADIRMTRDRQDVILFGPGDRIWTARISLRSCQQYRNGRGYPPCTKFMRNPRHGQPIPRGDGFP